MSKLSINETTLTAIGDAIREKTGKTDLIAPGNMPNEIKAIETGGGEIEVEPIVLTDDISNMCSGPMASNYIKLFGNTISTKDITNCTNCFKNNTVENIPFEINCSTTLSVNLMSMFYVCSNLKSIPKINNAKPSDLTEMFNCCYSLRYLPDDFSSWFDFKYIDTATSTYGNGMGSRIFNYCYSLRSVPMDFLNHNNPYINSAYGKNLFRGLFQRCYCLDEIVGLPIYGADKMAWTSNMFLDTFTGCYRAKNITFATNEDGSPIQVNWKNQDISFLNMGYSSSSSNFTGYNSGITADKEVKDDTTYQALKNDPDWFATNQAYSRYNHDSAVATINSLPDTTSSGGTNTIRYMGNHGSATDGGAINALTEEEIAVATAKGWTVTIS